VNDNAPGQKTEGAVMNMPGGHVQDSGPRRRNASCRTLRVELYRNTARLHGGRVPQLLDLAGVEARMYDRQHACWTVPVTFADDVITVAEHRQRRFVTVEEVTR
jgi:hypothetical protein